MLQPVARVSIGAKSPFIDPGRQILNECNRLSATPTHSAGSPQSGRERNGFFWTAILKDDTLTSKAACPQPSSFFKESVFAMKRNALRAMIEAGFIIFLFYSNLLMGEFERSGMGPKKGLAWAITDVFTSANFEIAMIAALIGYVFFEFLRKKFWGNEP
jgi:hypothetical protein